MKKALLTAVVMTSAVWAAAPTRTKDEKPHTLSINPEGRILPMFEGKAEPVYTAPGVATAITLEHELIVGTFYGGYNPKFPKLSVIALEKEHSDISIEPRKAGLTTNLTIVTDKKNRYHLLVVPSDATHPADNAIFLEPADTAEQERVAGTPAFVPVDLANTANLQVDELRKQTALLSQILVNTEAQTAQTKKAAAQADSAEWKYDYRFDHLKEPFRVKQIRTNGTITEIITDNGKDGAVYAMLPGKKSKPEHTQTNKDFDPNTHTWTIYAPVNEGVLVLGAEKLHFARAKKG